MEILLLFAVIVLLLIFQSGINSKLAELDQKIRNLSQQLAARNSETSKDSGSRSEALSQKTPAPIIKPVPESELPPVKVPEPEPEPEVEPEVNMSYLMTEEVEEQ